MRSMISVSWTAATSAGGAGAAKPLIAALHYTDPNVRVESVGARALGEARTVEPLIAALHDADRKVRVEAVGALRAWGDAHAIEPLIAALTDEDGDVRGLAIEALGEIGDARAVGPIIACVVAHPSVYARDVYAPGPGQLVQIGDAPALRAALKNTDKRVRLVAAEALVGIGDVDGVCAAASDEDREVRWAAYPGLVKFRDARAVEPLCVALTDAGDLDLPCHAADALGAIGDARAVEPLCAALAASAALDSRGHFADTSLTGFIVRALDRIGDARVVGPLRALRFAQDAFGRPQPQDTEARIQAVEALRKIGGAPDQVSGRAAAERKPETRDRSPQQSLDRQPRAARQGGADVLITEVGNKRLQVIKAVRTLTNLDIPEAAEIVDARPSRAVLANVSHEEAERAKAQLEAPRVGATVEIIEH